MEITKTLNLIDGVMDLSERLLESPDFVTLNKMQIVKTAHDLKVEINERKEFWMGYPKWFEPEVREEGHIDYMLLAYELMAGAVNYQYWFGKSDVRPNEAGSTSMYEILDECFEGAGAMHSINHRIVCEDAARAFMTQLSLNRLPNAEKRMGHVKEILDMMYHGPNPISNMARDISRGQMELDDFIRRVISLFPGYAGDMFLKRSFLVAMMLYRRVQWFKDQIHLLPVPADYQIPKMLQWYGCIEYSDELRHIIANDRLIPSGSLMECEIRAASILACKALADIAEVTMCDVDTYLWLNRKQCVDRFHLTVTTDY